MKKLISFLAAVVALFATSSCVREVDYIQDPSQAVTVSYSVALDQVQKTKATLAELDGLAVDKLFYSVFQLTGTDTYTAIAHSDYHGVKTLTGNTAELTFKLIQGETYKVVFWAQKGSSYVSTVDKDHPLGEINIDYTAVDSYATDWDAFTAYDVITLSSVAQAADGYGTTFTKEIHLKRPFAQINFGADDTAQAAAQGYVPGKVKVTVKQAASKFNVATGEASAPVDAALKEVDLPEVAVNFDVNNVTYQRVAKAYVLPVGTFTVTQDGTSAAITSPLSSTPEVSMVLTIKKGENTFALDPRSKSNVAVRSNYRTNLLGSLITTDATFTVVVDNDYDGSTDHVSIVSLGNATGNGDVTMNEAETVSSNINFGEHPVTLNETMTITGEVTISNGASLTVNKAIEVAEGATLTLDNVTIDNASTAPEIKVSKGATLIINGGIYTATDVDQLFNLLTSTIVPLRIKLTGNSTKGELIIRGGSFKGDPTAYVDTDHYVVTDNNDGTFTVTQKPVTLTIEAGDVSMKLGDEAVLKTLTVDPADTDLTGISFEYSVDNVATASYSEGKISVAAVGVGSTVITVKVGTATATINVTVAEVDAVSINPTSVTVYPGNDSESITITANNNQTIESVVSGNPDVVTVAWTSGASTFKVHGEVADANPVNVTVTTSGNKTAVLTVTVSTAPKLATPQPFAAGAFIDEDGFIVMWDAINDATAYEVKYALKGSSEFTTLANNAIDITKNPVEAVIEGLAPATEYTVKVVAKDGTNFSPSDEGSVDVTTKKGTVTIVLVKDEFDLIEGTDPEKSQAQIQASVKYGNTVVDGATLTYAVKNDDFKGNVTVSNTGLVTAGVGEAAATILVGFEGNAIYNETNPATVTVGVSAKTLESISLNTELVKKDFVVGDQFSSSNLKVKAHYNNNTEADVNPTSVSPEVDALSSTGTKIVTVSYTEGDVTKNATYEITVSEPAAPQKTDQSITLTYNNAAIGATLNKTYGDAAFTITAEAPSNNVVLTSGNTAVATVSGTTITIVGVGSAVITANAAETESYNAAEPVSFTVAVAKADLAAPTVTATAGDDKKITVTWASVTGAASYTVKIGETETANATSPFVTAALANGTYAVSVKAIGDANHNDSAYSTAQNVEIADATPTTKTVSEIIALADASEFSASEALVVAKNSRGVVVTDGTNNVLVYNWADNASSTASINIGDVITFDGTKKTYNGVPEIDPVSNIVVKSSGNDVTYPTATDITDTFADYAGTTAEYISFTGTLAVSGNYYNVNVAGVTSKQGSVSFPSDPSVLVNGKNVKLTGYYNGASGSGGKYINIILVSVEPVVATTTLSVADIEVKEGQDKSIVPTVNPSNAVITYALKNASDSEFVTVDNSTAKVHGVKKTTTPVVVVATVAAVDGEYTAASVEFNVTVVEDNGSGSEVIDTITSDLLTATNTTYTDFTNVSATSDARYAGNSAKSSGGGIQMRSKNSNSGIVSTVSGGTVKSVKITVESGSNTIDVYGSNTAYTGAADLYATGDNNNQGTKIGSLTATGTIEFTDEYRYVGIRSNSGAIYVTSVEITWNN